MPSVIEQHETIHLALVVQKVNSAIHHINHNPVVSIINKFHSVIRWIENYLVDNPIHLSNDRVLMLWPLQLWIMYVYVGLHV